MTCEVCGDKGLVRLNWADAPDDYAVCLCEEGLRLRVDRNNGKSVAPLWLVWCGREQIDPSRMFLIEEVLTPDELTERELRKPAVSMNREAALLAAGKQKAKR
jgi:hypothetical protein